MTVATTFEQDADKLIEATIYLCELSIDDPDFDVSKLAKLLYFADFDSYLLQGKPITGTTYLHFPHGPYPENWHRIRQQMESNGDVEILFDTTGSGYQQYWVLPLRAANLERLSSQDAELLQAQVKRFGNFNSAGLEQYSHQELGWRTTEDGEPIPYELAGVFSPRLSAREIRDRRSSIRLA